MMDDSGFQSFFSSTYLKACRFAAGIVDPAYVEDTVQDAFYRLYLKRFSIKEDGEPTAYFFKILYNLCLNRLRRKKVWNRIKTMMWSRPAPENPLFSRLAEAWNDLSPREKAVFILMDYLDCDAGETAEILSIKPATLRVMRHRVKNKITAREEAI